jgi:hypothetical protein
LPAFYETRRFVTVFITACSLSLVSILRQMNWINTLLSHGCKSILILILQNTVTWSLSFRFVYQNFVHSPYVLMHATCNAHFTVPDLTEPGAWGYNWATLPLGDINTETCSSRLGVRRKADGLAL